MTGSAGRWPRMTSVSVLGVDTNVLVRFLSADDPIQSPLATRLITNKANQPIHVSIGVLVETYLVLARVEKLPRADLNAALSLLLSSPDFVIEKSALAARALADAADGGFDFTDALFSVLSVDAGCTATATFDKRAQKLSGMIAVEDGI